MPRARKNGNGRLDETVANLNQSMAILNQAMATFLARMAESDARFARIEAETGAIHRRMDDIETILQEHSQVLEALPDAVRAKFGFQPPER
jgi:hypothetical protein